MILKEIDKQAAFYRKEQKVFQYAMEFWHDLCACGDSFEMNDTVLPIQCFDELETIIEAVERGSKTRVAGSANSFRNKQAVIRIGINGDNDRLSPSLKRTIRHEIIHYFLWLMDKPHTDNSLEFWCLCYAFDGGAYESLDDADKHKYDLFVQTYDTKIKTLPDNIRKIIIGAMVPQIGKSEYEFTKNIEEDIKKLKMFFHI